MEGEDRQNASKKIWKDARMEMNRRRRITHRYGDGEKERDRGARKQEKKRK